MYCIILYFPLRSENKQSLGELFVGFFKYYAVDYRYELFQTFNLKHSQSKHLKYCKFTNQIPSNVFILGTACCPHFLYSENDL